MKRPTYWTSIVIRPKRSPADMAIRALLHSAGNGCHFENSHFSHLENSHFSHFENSSFSLTWQDFLLGADEVDNDGAKDESVEEHDGLEASVAEESADDAKDEVERADGGSVRVVGANNFEVVLHHQIVPNS